MKSPGGGWNDASVSDDRPRLANTARDLEIITTIDWYGLIPTSYFAALKAANARATQYAQQ